MLMSLLNEKQHLWKQEAVQRQWRERDYRLYASFPVFLITKFSFSRNCDLHSRACRNWQLNYMTLMLFSSRLLCHRIASLYIFPHWIPQSRIFLSSLTVPWDTQYREQYWNVKGLFPLKWERLMKTVVYNSSSTEGKKIYLYPENMLYELKISFPIGYPAINGIEKECSSFHCLEIQ